MAFSRNLLNEGEDVVLDLHPHWVTFLLEGVALFAAVVLGIVLLVNGWEGLSLAFAGILVVAALIWCGVTYLRWVTTNFVITTDRLIYRHGVLAKHGIEIPLDRVNTVFFSQRLYERMLGSGDLTIESAGEKGTQTFANVRRPSAVQNEIYRQMEANENRKFDRVRAAPGEPAATAPGASIPEQIAQLDQLRQQGILSQAEFDAKKQDLLGRM